MSKRERNKFKGTCEQCGKVIYSEYRSTLRRFCTHKCSNQWKWDNIRKRKETIDFTCKNCGKPIKIRKSDQRIKEGQNDFFCSYYCSGEYVRKLHNKTCPICGKIFHPQKTQTCSSQCGRKFAALNLYRRKLGNNNVSYADYCKHIEQTNKEKEERRNRSYICKGREKEYLREYRHRNREKLNARQRERFANNPVASFKALIRKRMSNWFRRKNSPKQAQPKKY